MTRILAAASAAIALSLGAEERDRAVDRRDLRRDYRDYRDYRDRD